ncbi:RNA polymerase sigma factor [Actinomadura barringtoniae]|uniref:RNA polymerase sigma factor n=1 Tax=Actinomadura barringtoniae TaxID=1427535 RepID=A0A939T166_9ACTN|nr:RNA polymerase sigma factor [Actinomadura barringtoniae]MBO2446901.1 RNA polymerase sigma factor [Actinomadura barringtoniae]
METKEIDAELIGRSLRAPEDFAAVFERYGDQVHRYLARRAGPDQAEDLVSDTFLTAFEQRDRFDPERSPSGALPWLLGIATMLLRSHRRAEARRLRTLAGTAGLADVPEPFAERITAQVDAGAAARSLLRTLAALPDGERDALLLMAWADLRYEDIAVALDIPVGTVRSRIHRARTRLRTALAERATTESELS